MNIKQRIISFSMAAATMASMIGATGAVTASAATWTPEVSRASRLTTNGKITGAKFYINNKQNLNKNYSYLMVAVPYEKEFRASNCSQRIDVTSSLLTNGYAIMRTTALPSGTYRVALVAATKKTTSSYSWYLSSKSKVYRYNIDNGGYTKTVDIPNPGSPSNPGTTNGGTVFYYDDPGSPSNPTSPDPGLPNPSDPGSNGGLVSGTTASDKYIGSGSFDSSSPYARKGTIPTRGYKGCYLWANGKCLGIIDKDDEDFYLDSTDVSKFSQNGTYDIYVSTSSYPQGSNKTNATLTVTGYSTGSSGGGIIKDTGGGSSSTNYKIESWINTQMNRIGWSGGQCVYFVENYVKEITGNYSYNLTSGGPTNLSSYEGQQHALSNCNNKLTLLYTNSIQTGDIIIQFAGVGGADSTYGHCLVATSPSNAWGQVNCIDSNGFGGKETIGTGTVSVNDISCVLRPINL